MTTRVLVIDDELSVRTLVNRVFSQNGFNVLMAVIGQEGLQMAARDKPDLVILDLNLPDINGEDVCHKIRQSPDTSNIPVLILTGKLAPGLSARCLNGGADAYLAKPFDVEEIVAYARALLRRSRTSAEDESIISNGRLTIRVAERMVLWKGVRVQMLAPKEFEVLRLLVSRAPRVIDKNALAMSAWGAPIEELHQRTLDVHIRRLRKKLGPAAAICLKTIPSVGFQWLDESTVSPQLSTAQR